MSEAPPNVVLIHCHDLGRHLGCYDRGVETPHIDRLAGEGTRFTDYFCPAPQCSPSRGSIMTGRYPHNNGLMGLAHRGWSLDDEERALPEYLQNGGYHTVQYGFQHVGDSERLGFETVREAIQFPQGYDGPPRWPALDIAEAFESTVEDELAGDRPFYAHVGFDEPHLPYQRSYVPEEAYDYYHPENVEVPDFLPDTRGVREDIAELNALITATTDRGVGRVCEALEDADLEDETLVLFTTDHGLDLPGAKAMCYDPGLETALVARGPGVPEGTVRKDLLSNVDLLPTLLEFCGVDFTPPRPLDGRSFAPLLSDDPSVYEERERIFAERTWHSRYDPIRVLRTNEYKYLRNFTASPRRTHTTQAFATRSGRGTPGGGLRPRAPHRGALRPPRGPRGKREPRAGRAPPRGRGRPQRQRPARPVGGVSRNAPRPTARRRRPDPRRPGDGAGSQGLVRFQAISTAVGSEAATL